VIERPIDDVLDIGGWDLRKALRLMAGSNAVLMEWLTSPVRYRGDTGVIDRMLRLSQETGRLPSYRYHYDRLARRSFNEIRATPEAARLKAYCYALRATLAVLWLQRLKSLPPMDMPRLLEGIGPSQTIRDAIADLVTRKAVSREGDMTARISSLDAFMEEALSDPAPRPSIDDQTQDKTRFDRIFREIAFSRSDHA
jgi:predicted nucleotidyltransferase